MSCFANCPPLSVGESGSASESNNVHKHFFGFDDWNAKFHISPTIRTYGYGRVSWSFHVSMWRTSVSRLRLHALVGQISPTNACNMSAKAISPLNEHERSPVESETVSARHVRKAKPQGRIAGGLTLSAVRCIGNSPSTDMVCRQASFEQTWVCEILYWCLRRIHAAVISRLWQHPWLRSKLVL